jgi:uncharacterized membrane protein YfcA
MWLLILGILAVFGISFIYSNLGMGGGVLFVPLLLAITIYNEDTVVAISLCLVLANCMTSLWNHQREKLVDWKLGGTMAFGAGIGTVMGALFNINTGKEVFLLLFLAVVVAVIAKMLIDWKNQAKVCEEDVESKMTKKRLSAASTGTLASGFMSGALGLGGGVINVPLLIYVLGRCTKRAAGTSFVIMLVSGFIGLATYIASGIYIDWMWVAALAPVVFLGSFIGSRWGIKKLKGRQVQLLFILVLGLAIAKSLYDLWLML